MAKKASIVHKKAPRTNGKGRAIQYVFPVGNGWVVKNSRARKFTAISDKRNEAIKIARELAAQKGLELIVHAKDGSIVEHKDYAE